jgi:hypothetical protein
VHDEARLGLVGRHLPQLLHADCITHRLAALVELELADQHLAEMAACTLGEDRVLGVQLHAELELAGGLAVLADAEVAGGHALDRTVVVEEDLGRCEAREDLDAQRFGVLAHPAHHIAQADDVVAFVVHAVGHQEVGRAPGSLLAQHQHVVAGHGLVQGCPELFPVRDQFGQRTRVHHCAAQDVGARLRAFFEHDDRDLLALFGGKLFQADRGGQATGAGTDDQHVVFHRFARAVLFEQGLRGHEDLSAGLELPRFYGA